jgi:hypothetical protein
LIALAVGVAGDLAGAWTLRASDAMAGLLLLIGAALVLTAWWGRARWLVPVGVLVAVAALSANAVQGVSLHPSIGDVTVRPSASTLESQYSHGAGNLRLDLTDPSLRSSPLPHRVDVELTVGDMTVTVPTEVAVRVTATASAGRVEVWPREAAAGVQPTVDDGLDASVSRDLPAVGAGTTDVPVFVLDLKVGAGSITVRREVTGVTGSGALVPGPAGSGVGA